ncbi:MAG: hypothetical protein ACREKL_17090 [Chthoniobacterales bacterium]
MKPDAWLLWDLADLYERDGNAGVAQWVCEVAVAFGLGGESADFAGKLTAYRGGANCRKP